MRLALNPRARRLLRRVPRTTVYTALELVLLSLLAIQCARLFWALLTPVDPLGQWRSSAFRPTAPVSTALFGSFDPFFRLSAAGPAVVTSLDLKLFGVREDRATGHGSAIVQTPDGVQKSYSVGDEIMPGVKLAAVNFDSISVNRGGTMEQLFLDQSQPATAVGPASDTVASPAPMRPLPVPIVPVAAPAAPPAPPQLPNGLAGEIRAEPRLENGRVTGVLVNPQGSGAFFAMSGLRPNDIVLSVNGQAISTPDQVAAVVSRLGGGEANVTVERGGRPMTFHLRTHP